MKSRFDEKQNEDGKYFTHLIAGFVGYKAGILAQIISFWKRGGKCFFKFQVLGEKGEINTNLLIGIYHYMINILILHFFLFTVSSLITTNGVIAFLKYWLSFVNTGYEGLHDRKGIWVVGTPSLSPKSSKTAIWWRWTVSTILLTVVLKTVSYY